MTFIYCIWSFEDIRFLIEFICWFTIGYISNKFTIFLSNNYFNPILKWLTVQVDFLDAVSQSEKECIYFHIVNHPPISNEPNQSSISISVIVNACNTCFYNLVQRLSIFSHILFIWFCNFIKSTHKIQRNIISNRRSYQIVWRQHLIDCQTFRY